MSKMLKKHKLTERPAIRTLFAISLCATMAAFGCTTDRSVANGDPVVTPGLRSATLPPPMMSSSSVSASDAASIMAQHQRVRVLGVASPGNPGRPYVSDPTSIAQPATPISTDTFSANVVKGIPIVTTARRVNTAGAVRVINENGRIKISNQ